jgi:hypothetical protein
MTIATLLSFIAAGEGGYNSMNQGTQGGRIVGSTHNAASILGRNLTDMTVGEVMAHQSSSPRRLFAAGRYQIIPDTLKGILPSSGLTARDPFSPQNQDRLGLALIQRRKAAWDYLTGKSANRDAALLALAQEWASLPDPRTGNSFYGSGNRAQHTVAQVAAALDAARTSLSAQAPPPTTTPTTPGASTSSSSRASSEEGSASLLVPLLLVGGLAFALWRLRR